MNDTESIKATEAAELLLGVRRGRPRLAALPVACAPQTLAEAYAIQREVLRLQGTGIAGWKASLLDADSGVCAPLGHNAMKAAPGYLHTVTQRTRNTRTFGMEPEIAFTLGDDLPPLAGGAVYERATVTAAIASAHAAIELVVSRFADADAVTQLERVADGLLNEMLIIGPSCPGWTSLTLNDLPLEIRVDSKVVYQGRGGHPMVDPLLPVIWLANHLSQLGVGLRAGETITTGSCNGLRSLEAGQLVSAFFDGLGSATARL